MCALYNEIDNRMEEMLARLDKRQKIIIKKIERVNEATSNRFDNRENFQNPIDPLEIRVVGLPKGLKGAELKSAVNEIFKACYCDDKHQDYSSQIALLRSWGHRPIVAEVQSSSKSTVIVVGLKSSWIRDTLMKNAYKLKDFDAESTLGMETDGGSIYLSPVWPEWTYKILKRARSELKKFVDAPKPVVRNFIVCMRLPGDRFSLYPVYSEKDAKSFVDDHRSAFDKSRTTAVDKSNSFIRGSTAAASSSSSSSADDITYNVVHDLCKDCCSDRASVEALYRYVKLVHQQLQFNKQALVLMTQMRKTEFKLLNFDCFIVLEDPCEIKITGLPRGMDAGEIDGALKEIFKACGCSNKLSSVVRKRSWGFDRMNPEESIIVVKFDSKVARDFVVRKSHNLKHFNGKKAFGHRADRKIRITTILPKISYELMREAQSEMKELGGPAPVVRNMMVFMRAPDLTVKKNVSSEMDLDEFVKEYKANYVNNQ